VLWKTVPAGGIWLLDGHDPTWFGEGDHFTNEVLILTYWSEDKTDMDQIERLAREGSVVDIRLTGQ
jgi:hypothetical protein